VCALVLLCGFARSGVCQEMSFSFYSDASVSGSTVYGTITGSDLSSGCSHWNYYTDAWMYGPTGGNSYTQVSGVGAQISLPSAGAGNYDFYSSTTFLCDCVGGSVNAGGVAEVVQSGLYRHHYNYASQSGWYNYTLDEDSQNRQCSSSTRYWNEYSPSGMTDEGLARNFRGNLVACISLCSGGKTGSVVGPAGTTRPPSGCEL
jgi:hypothetical protein